MRKKLEETLQGQGMSEFRWNLEKLNFSGILGFITLLSVALKISFRDSWKFWSVVRGVRRGG